METVRQRSSQRSRSERGFGHAIAFVLVVVFAVLVVAVVAVARKHAASIDTGAATKAVGPSVVAVNDAGSGVAISPHEIVTAAHLVDTPGVPIIVETARGNTTATLAGYDRAADIALLRLPQSEPALTPAPTGDSQSIGVGDAVVVLSNTGPTRGTVKDVTNDAVAIAAPLRDAAVGGPVVDVNDDVVAVVRGVNAAATADTVPWNAVVSIVNAIDAGHSTATVHVGPVASLGMTVAPVAGSPGVRVIAVPAGSAAATAGIAKGDIIASVRGVPVSSERDVDTALDPAAPGDTVSVAVFDTHGILHTVSVPLVPA
jgi:S1-C subfamily serine protease